MGKAMCIFTILLWSAVVLQSSEAKLYCTSRSSVDGRVVCKGNINGGSRRKLCDAVKANQAVEIQETDLVHLESSLFCEPSNTTRLLVIFNDQLTGIDDDAFAYLKRLQHLDLSDNVISTLGTTVFFPLTHLKELILDYNRIERIESGMFSNQKELTLLSLKGNKLTSLRNDMLSSLIQLEVLHADNNRLNFIDGRTFVSLERLKFLNLSRNNLSVLPSKLFSYQTNLEELYIDSNNISSLSDEVFSPMSSMEVLSFGGNSIRSMNLDLFRKLASLKILDVVGCPLKCDCSLKDIYEWCDSKSVKTNLICEFSSGNDSVKVLKEMECGFPLDFKQVLLISVVVLTLGALISPLMWCVCRRNKLGSWRSSVSVNEYDYIQSPVRQNTRPDELGSKTESDRYASIMNNAPSVYDYLPPTPRDANSSVGSYIRDSSPVIHMPKNQAPLRPAPAEYINI